MARTTKENEMTSRERFEAWMEKSHPEIRRNTHIWYAMESTWQAAISSVQPEIAEVKEQRDRLLTASRNVLALILCKPEAQREAFISLHKLVDEIADKEKA
jgi:hypothetical protein